MRMILIGMLALGGAGAARADETPQAPSATAKAAPAQPPGASERTGTGAGSGAKASRMARPMRDPTTEGDVVGGGRASGGAQLPAIVLRGLIVAKDRPGFAVIEVEGRTIPVEAGSVISVGAASGAGSPQRVLLEVTAVTRDGVRIEVPGSRDVVVVR